MPDDISNEEALRAALLEVLLALPRDLLKTEEGRRELAGHYALAAGSAHPAVAAVMREAALKLRGRND